MSKPIRVQLTKAVPGYGPKGSQYGYDTEADATRVLGEGAFKVLGNQDGSLVDAPESEGTTPSLHKMTRDELDALAESKGIADASDMPNKDAVIAAIEGAA